MISLSMILDELNEFSLVYNEQDLQSQPTFCHLWPVWEGGIPTQMDTLYLCTPDQVNEYSKQYPDFWFCCPSFDNAPTPLRHILQVGHIDQYHLSETLKRFFDRISKWDRQMTQSIIHNEGIQKLLDLSEPIIGNFIAISDPSLKLVAYTTGLPPIDNISRRLLALGYHGAESVSDFRARRAFESWETSSGFVITNHHANNPPCTSVLKSYKCITGYSLLAVMTVPNDCYSNGLCDLFRILVEYIAYYVDRDYPATNNYHVHEPFLIDLVEGRLNNIIQIQERCDYTNINFHGNYLLMKLSFTDATNVPARRVLNEFLEIIPLSKGAVHKRELLVLCQFTLRENSEWSQIIDNLSHSIAPLVRRYGVLCGVSTPFHTIAEIHSAYIQCELALAYGHRLSSRECPFNSPALTTVHTENNFFKYDDFFVYHMLDISSSHSEHAIAETTCVRALDTLATYDVKHNTDNVQLLYTYLLSERKTSVTGELMHMHRNNVLYRIDRIQEITGLDLNDPDLRFGLLIA